MPARKPGEANRRVDTLAPLPVMVKPLPASTRGRAGAGRWQAQGVLPFMKEALSFLTEGWR